MGSLWFFVVSGVCRQRVTYDDVVVVQGDQWILRRSKSWLARISISFGFAMTQ